MKAKIAYELVVETGREFIRDKCPQLGAALAFYIALSLAPLLIVAIAIAGFVFGDDAARGQVASQLRDLVGDEGAKAVETMLASQKRSHGIVATVISIVTLVIGATGVFTSLKDALDTAWGVAEQDRPSGLLALLRNRLWAFLLVCIIGLLLLITIVISAVLNAMGGWMDSQLQLTGAWLSLANGIISFILTAILFALIFKVLPQIRPAWSEVWIGALLTTLLFTLGKYLIGLYLGTAAVSSAYGTAGSFVVLLIWIYYSTQILLFGAEFTQVYANQFGSGIVKVSAQQRMPPDGMLEHRVANQSDS